MTDNLNLSQFSELLTEHLVTLDLRGEAVEVQFRRVANALERIVSLLELHAVATSASPPVTPPVEPVASRAAESVAPRAVDEGGEDSALSALGASPPRRLDLVVNDDVGPVGANDADARTRTQGAAHGISNLLYYAVAPAVVRRLLRDERSIRHGLLTTTIDAETGMQRERRTRVLERLHKEGGFVETTMVKKGQPAMVRVTDVDRARAWLATYGARAEG